MKNLILKQKGITFIGLCFILAFLALVVTFVLRAFPLYNEKFQVTAAINSVVSRPDATSLSEADVRKYFLRNIAVSNVTRFKDANVKEYVEVIKPEKKGGVKMMHVKYEARNVLYGDIYLLMAFEKKVPLRGPSTGE